MPLLGDYVGRLVAELTQARVEADLESVRIAEMYAAHPLLKSMAVPRFRLPTVTLDVPVVVRNVEEKGPDGAVLGTYDMPVLRKAFDKRLAEVVKRAGIRLSAERKAQVAQALDETTRRLAQPRAVAVSVLEIADALVETGLREVVASDRDRRDTHTAKVEEAREPFRAEVRREFLDLRRRPPRLEVGVTGAELREADPRHIVRLQLSVSEQAFEWAVTESAGRPVERLVPE